MPAQKILLFYDLSIDQIDCKFLFRFIIEVVEVISIRIKSCWNCRSKRLKINYVTLILLYVYIVLTTIRFALNCKKKNFLFLTINIRNTRHLRARKRNIRNSLLSDRIIYKNNIFRHRNNSTFTPCQIYSLFELWMNINKSYTIVEYICENQWTIFCCKYYVNNVSILACDISRCQSECCELIFILIVVGVFVLIC